jgi:hypothetical protein
MGAEASATVKENGRTTEIAKLTVYHLAKFVLTETALTGEALEARSDTEKFESTDHALIEEALAFIAKARPADGDCDARWGLVFGDASDARVRSLYLDGFGTKGNLDGAPVKFDDQGLIEWLRAKYGEDSVLS